MIPTSFKSHQPLKARLSANPNAWRQRVRRGMAWSLPRRWFLVQGPRTSRSVCLTFDDGPHPEHTPRLLDVLREHGIPATFFVIGQQAECYPQLVRRIVHEGHVVGHHSYSHSDPRITSARQLLQEVRQTRDLLGRLLGEAPALFRPPHGKLTAAKLFQLWRAGQTVVLWNVDPKDYSRRSASEILEWFEKNPLQASDIVLMHDNHPHAAEVLSHLIPATRAKGLEFVTPLKWLGRQKDEA
jgi:peptidoglycan-N-acetylglucosamine deacetylase